MHTHTLSPTRIVYWKCRARVRYHYKIVVYIGGAHNYTNRRKRLYPALFLPGYNIWLMKISSVIGVVVIFVQHPNKSVVLFAIGKSKQFSINTVRAVIRLCLPFARFSVYGSSKCIFNSHQCGTITTKLGKPTKMHTFNNSINIEQTVYTILMNPNRYHWLSIKFIALDCMTILKLRASVVSVMMFTRIMLIACNQ